MIYTVNILSTNRLPQSASIGDAFYNINWSFLPNDCDYKMTFKFLSEQEAIVNGTSLNEIYILSSPDLGSRNCYYAGKTTTTQSSNDFGVIYPYFMQHSVAQTGTISQNTAPTPNTTTQTVGFNSYYGFKANASDNLPIYFRGRPSDNQLNIQIYNIDRTAIHALTADYVLMLNFEKVKSK